MYRRTSFSALAWARFPAYHLNLRRCYRTRRTSLREKNVVEVTPNEKRLALLVQALYSPRPITLQATRPVNPTARHRLYDGQRSFAIAGQTFVWSHGPPFFRFRSLSHQLTHLLLFEMKALPARMQIVVFSASVCWWLSSLATPIHLLRSLPSARTSTSTSISESFMLGNPILLPWNDRIAR